MAEQLTREDVTEAVKAAFTEGTLVSPETHEKHHRFLEEEIQAKKDCRANRKKITLAVLCFIAIAAVSWVAKAIWEAVQYGLITH